ncbi:MAG: hypothetical protein NTV65_06280 [Proteobacteria bacterium]|nr:hypothetical protein [Pseudomonadota bacterium]
MKRVFIPRTAICEAAQLSVITSALTLIITFTMTAKADDYIALRYRAREGWPISDRRSRAHL